MSVAESALRACLSRTSSAMRTRTVPGTGPSRSFHSRLAKADLSAVGPCLTMPTVLLPGRIMPASNGPARYQRRRMGNAAFETMEAMR